MKYFAREGKSLAIEHTADPESLYDNPKLYPSMFSWLFPYGYGGLGNSRIANKISDGARKYNLLMYYDKRFQLDQHFSLIVFNHEQIKASATGRFLLAEKKNFDDVVARLSCITKSTLESLIERLKDSPVTAQTEEEKRLFQLTR